jgi:DNA-binding response OmpR family regulator
VSVAVLAPAELCSGTDPWIEFSTDGGPSPLPRDESEIAVPRVRQARVLVVEDSLLMRRLICDALRWAGYAVVEAPNGVEALGALERARVERQPFSAMVLDLMLPKMDGLTLLLCWDGGRGQPPCIAISSDPKKLAVALRAGAAAILPKPFEPAHLVMLIAEHGLQV